jgi:hypothetical protein
MRIAAGAAMVSAALVLGGCATEQEIVQGRENMLAAAGFAARPADTPARQNELKTLPPHKFIYQNQGNNRVVYVYSDPTVCDCLYIGSEQAYQKYRQLAFQKQVADENLEAAQMNMNNWQWGAWGPGWWMY